MAIVTAKELTLRAEAGGYAVPAFNIDNLESALAVANAVKERRCSVIIQMIPRTLRYGGTAVYPAMVYSLLGKCDTDVAIHLDHASDFGLIKEAIDCGFSSVMIDGSALPFKQNIELTKQVTDYARSKGVSVEGELGVIGGKEEGDKSLEASYTLVSEAREFCLATDVDLLAIGVGTAHGIYKGEPKINIRRIKEIHDAVSADLVLHGASGLSQAVISAAIEAGVRKINFATELRQAFTAGLKEGLSALPDAFDPKQYLPYAIRRVEEAVKSKMAICNPDFKR